MDQAEPDSILLILDLNAALIERQCSAESQVWFLQPRTAALHALGRHAGVDSLLRDFVRSGGSWGTSAGKLLDRWAHSLYQLGRHSEADSLFERAYTSYRARRGGGIPEHAAMVLVNWAWNRYRLGFHQDALCKTVSALRVMNEACRDGCQAAELVFFRSEARRLRTAIEIDEAEGRTSPVNPLRCSGIGAEGGEEGAGLRPGALLLGAFGLGMMLCGLFVLLTTRSAIQRSAKAARP